jgi:hypothetical protein
MKRVDDPAFEHAPFTVEGEIERFGAFGRGGAAAHGWKRWLAVALVVLVVVGVAIGLLADLLAH